MKAAIPPATTLEAAGDYTLNSLLAGNHERVRIFTLGDGRRIALPPYTPPAEGKPVTWKWLGDRIGYIRIENSLGSQKTVAAFNAAAKQLRAARGLVLDLRFTPSGGNTNVAVPILGRFVTTEAAYQRYEGHQFNKGVELDTVPPRGPFTLTAPLVVLVSQWTGSMGEGMAIGLDAIKRGVIVGTKMAGLRGGVKTFTLPNTGVPVSFPVFRIKHIDGTPREDFNPRVVVDLRSATGSDPILAAGLKELHRLMTSASD